MASSDRPPCAPVQKAGTWAATAVVIGSMIGTGVYVSLGFQVAVLPSGFHILLLWLLGGALAFMGATCYSELAAALPRSGGEYHFLSEIYHPVVGFLSGWISILAGFAGPVAIAALAFGNYAVALWPGPVENMMDPRPPAVALILAVTVANLISFRTTARFQGISTALKVVLLVVLIVCGFWLAPAAQPVSFLPAAGDWKKVWSPEFFNSLYFVLYAYSGWNAACYITGEVDQPQRRVPLALLLGTGLVTALYLGLNAAFLHAAPMVELSGQTEAGLIAARHIFGPTGGVWASLLICLGLVSTVGAMMWIGPRVSQRMGEDYRLLGFLAQKNRRGLPANATVLQCVIALAYLVLFENPGQMMTYVEFLLQVSLLLTVLGVYVLRRRQPDLPRPCKAWGYPLTPAIFVFWICASLAWLLRMKEESSLKGLVTVGAGLVVYLLCRAEKGQPPKSASRKLRTGRGDWRNP